MHLYTVFTSAAIPNCPYCIKAKALLDRKNIPYVTKVIGEDILLKEFRQLYPDAKTVPFIINPEGGIIGTYDNLVSHLNNER